MLLGRVHSIEGSGVLLCLDHALRQQAPDLGLLPALFDSLGATAEERLSLQDFLLLVRPKSMILELHLLHAALVKGLIECYHLCHDQNA